MSRYHRRIQDWLQRRSAMVHRTLTSAVQVAIAAGVAWWLADLVLPWADPLYAPIAAVIAIGAGENRLAGVPLRLLGGMIAAVAIASVGVGILGSGAWQIVVITLLTTVAGRFLFDDALARSYAAFHGAVIAAMGSTQVIPEQIIEAVIGSVVALVTVHVVLPPAIESVVLSPVQRAAISARRSLQAASTALSTGHHHESHRAVRSGVQIEATLAPADQRWAFARQVAAISPLRRRERARARELIEADRQLSDLLLEVSGLARLVNGVVSRDAVVRPELAAAVDELDMALRWTLQDPVNGADGNASAVTEAVRRSRSYLNSLDGKSPQEEMVCERVKEMGENLEHAARHLAERARADTGPTSPRLR